MGICTSTGVIRDFAGPYFVSVSNSCCNNLFVLSLAASKQYEVMKMKSTFFLVPINIHFLGGTDTFLYLSAAINGHLKIYFLKVIKTRLICLNS